MSYRKFLAYTLIRADPLIKFLKKLMHLPMHAMAIKKNPYPWSEEMGNFSIKSSQSQSSVYPLFFKKIFYVFEK